MAVESVVTVGGRFGVVQEASREVRDYHSPYCESGLGSGRWRDLARIQVSSHRTLTRGLMRAIFPKRSGDFLDGLQVNRNQTANRSYFLLQ